MEQMISSMRIFTELVKLYYIIKVEESHQLFVDARD